MFRQNMLWVLHKNLILKEGDILCVVYHAASRLKGLFELTLGIPKFIVYFGINSFAYAFAKMVPKDAFKGVFFIDEDPVQYRSLEALYPEFSFIPVVL